MSTESSNKLTGWHLLQVVILWNSCCFNKKYLQNVQTVSLINIYKMNKFSIKSSLSYSAAFSCPHRSTHHSYTYWYSPTPGPMFVGDITIDNIVFSNPMTIYLLTMDNFWADKHTFANIMGTSIINSLRNTCHFNFSMWVDVLNWIPRAWSVLCGHFLSRPGHDFYIVYYVWYLLQCVDGQMKDIKTMI